MYLLSHLLFSLALALATATNTNTKNTTLCYNSPLPPLPSFASTQNRTIPWGAPTFALPNGTLCCDSLSQIRAGIDDVDAQLLELLAMRAAYVREATRFKGTLATVDVPSRNTVVIEGAVNSSRETNPRLPETIARAVFETIINASVPFEKCIYGSFEENGCGD
ncbi:unnamed protein product [Diplocarpon coronariae]